MIDLFRLKLGRSHWVVLGAATLVAFLVLAKVAGFWLAFLAVLLLAVLAYAMIRRDNLDNVIFWLLILKPLVDCFWETELSTAYGQRVNPQSIVALLPIALLLLAVARYGWRLVRAEPLAIVLFVFPVIAVLRFYPLGVKELFKLWSGLALFLIAGNLFTDERRYRLFLRIFTIAVAGLIALCLLQFIGVLPYRYFEQFNGPDGRLTGLYRHPLNLTSFLIIGHIALLMLLVERFRGWIVYGLLALIYFVLYFTFHRTSLVIVAMDLSLFSVVYRRFWPAVLFVVIVFLSSVISPVGREYMQTVAGGLGAQRLSAAIAPKPKAAPVVSEAARPVSGERRSLARRVLLRGRVVTWSYFLHDFMRRSPTTILFGSADSIAYRPDTHEFSDEPHGDYLRLFMCYGAVWVAIYLIFLACLLSRSLFLAFSAVPFHAELGFVSFVLLLGYVAMSVPMEMTRFPSSNWYTLVFASSASALFARRRDSLS